MFRRGSVFYAEETATGKQTSLRTKDEAEATTLLNTKNEATRQPAMNLEFAQVYLQHADPTMAQRTLSLTDEELLEALGEWRIGVLKEYLMEVSGRVVELVDNRTPRLLLEEKIESARNEALGKWVAQSAWELEVHIPTSASRGPKGLSRN